MSRIAWIEDADAPGPVEEAFAEVRGAFGGRIPDIIRTMSLRPDFLTAIWHAMRMHFSAGALTEAQHEMVASLVAMLIRNRYCLSNHTTLLQAQGEQYAPLAQALRDGDLGQALWTPSERLLLEFVETLTLHPSWITDEQVQGLRDIGWTDAQIAEATYDGALFNLIARLAEAFALVPRPQDEQAGIPGALTRASLGFTHATSAPPQKARRSRWPFFRRRARAGSA